MADPAKLYKYECDRRRRMPEMIETAERKLAGLYREATRYGLDEILADRNLINEAWDRETMLAYLEEQEAQRVH